MGRRRDDGEPVVVPELFPRAPGTIIALDMATRTGWSAWSAWSRTPRSVVAHGAVDLAGSSGDSHGLRFHRLRRFLTIDIDGLIDLSHGGTHLAYERPIVRGGPTTRLLVGFRAVALEVAAERGWTTSSYNITSVKKLMAGRGNAKKPEVIAAANRWLEDRGLAHGITDDNEADAVGVMACAMADLGIRIDARGGEEKTT